MSYSDVMKAVDMHGGALNKTMSSFSNKGNNINNSYASQGTNPWSSGAYTMGDYRDFASSQDDIYDDRAMYNEMGSGMTNFDKNLMRGAKGMQGYTMGKQLSPYLSSKNAFNLGPAAGVYGAFGTDNNPYTFTDTEKYGGTVSNMMAAHQVSKLLPATNMFAGGTALTLGSTAAAALPMGIAAAPAVVPLAAGVAGPAALATTGASAGGAAMGVNPYVMIAALAFSFFNNKRRKKKANKANEKVAREIGEEDTRLYEERSDKLQENRDDLLAQQGSYQHGQDASRYNNQYGGNYSNRYQYNEGGKLTPKEMKKVQNLGRRGDTMLAHINPQEAQMLKQMGGSGTINPYTGLREYNWLTDGLGFISDTIGGVLGTAADIVNPVFDAAGNIITPVMEGAGDVVNTVGEEVLTPVVDGIASGLRAGVKGGMGALDAGLRPVLGLGIDVLQGLGNLFDSSGEDGIQVNTGEAMDPTKRGADIRTMSGDTPNSNIKFNPNAKIKGDKTKESYKGGDWVSDKENPYIAPNVEEEIDYAAQGMKYKYADGGEMNVVAEFTGNELIVNEQDQVEQAIANGNYAAAAAPIRRAMANKQVTPGPETHKNNPMPVDADGNIYAGGGKLNFKVNKGAGVYDHASDQFKPTMTDREISMVVSNNMAKWESNNMA